MKLFFKYLKQQKFVLWYFLLAGFIFLSCFYLYRLPLKAVLYPLILCVLLGIVFIAVHFFITLNKHNNLTKITDFNNLPGIDSELSNNILENDYKKIINLLNKVYLTEQTKNFNNFSETVNYYTVWAHQIKTPIASIKLKLQNEDSPLVVSLMSDLNRIEQYVEMVMTYLRLNSNSTDYLFKQYNLDSIIKQAVKKFSSEFITRKLTLSYSPQNLTVITDEKWLTFCIEQILSNALKYTQTGGITIMVENGKTLKIKDTGIGIAAEDLPRIFENGFTGYNGRTDKKASGIGLYLCRRICNNLGLNITASSTIGVGTEISIVFNKTNLEIE